MKLTKSIFLKEKKKKFLEVKQDWETTPQYILHTRVISSNFICTKSVFKIYLFSNLRA